MATGDRFRLDELEWDELVDTTVAILTEVARGRDTIRYGELATALRRRGEPEVDPYYGPMPSLLEAASLRVREKDPDAPLISALVYRADTNRPGKGFFKLAERVSYRIDEEDAFWAAHVNDVHEWARRR